MIITEYLNPVDCAEPKVAFEKYADMVYRLAFVRTRNSHDSDDILQEVFLRYIKVWQKLESDEHVKAMLIKITINCSNSLLTSAWFKRTVPLNNNITAMTNNNLDLLNEVLKLPIKYRTVIHLHYYMGYSVNEMANLINTKPSTIKTRLLRGRKILKAALRTEEF